MPLAYGTPSEELGPDSETLSPTFRSAAKVGAANASAAAAAVASRMKAFIMCLLSRWKVEGHVADPGAELVAHQQLAGSVDIARAVAFELVAAEVAVQADPVVATGSQAALDALEQVQVVVCHDRHRRED